MEYFGHENLELVSIGDNFNNWMYEQIFPAIKGDILEIGSGLGTFSEKIIQDFSDSSITLSDISIEYIEKLKEKFAKQNVSVVRLDLNSIDDYLKIGNEKFDTMIALNVLEHVEKDVFALKQLYKMLKKNGKLILLVPSHKFLFNAIDSNIGHHRRYTKNELENKIKQTQFSIIRIFYFNLVGIIGWYINGNLRKNTQIDTKAFKLFDKLVPVFRKFELLLQKKAGLSLICYLEK